MSRISGDQILVLQNCWWLSGQGLPVVYWPWLQLCRHNCGSASFLSHLLTSHWPKQVIRLSLVLREGTGHCACSAVGEAGCRERWRTGPFLQSTMLGRSPRTATSALNTLMRRPSHLDSGSGLRMWPLSTAMWARTDRVVGESQLQ